MPQKLRNHELFTVGSLASPIRWRCILNQINVNNGRDVSWSGQSANLLQHR